MSAKHPTLAETRLERRKSNGVWEIRWTEQDAAGISRTRTYSCGTKDRGTAEEIRAIWLSRGKANTQADPTIAEIIKNYCDGHLRPGQKAPTQAMALVVIQRSALGALPFSEFNNAQWSEYRREREADGVATGTLRRELGALTAAVNWNVATGTLPKGTEMPRITLPPQGQPREVYLKPHEEAFVYGEALKRTITTRKKQVRLTRIARFVVLALDTAARSKTIERLKWSQVDFTQGVIDYREPGKAITKKRVVPVPISTRLRPVLERMFNERVSEYVLDHPGSTRKAWELFRADIGMPNLDRHDLRRTWATLAAQNRVSMWQIAGVLGDTLATVERHYLWHHPDNLHNAVNARFGQGAAAPAPAPTQAPEPGQVSETDLWTALGMPGGPDDALKKFSPFLPVQ